jgi:hypothetical protein
MHETGDRSGRQDRNNVESTHAMARGAQDDSVLGSGSEGSLLLVLVRALETLPDLRFTRLIPRRDD